MVDADEQGVAVAALFDDYGRCIPAADLAGAVHRKTRRYFTLTQPEIDYAAIHARIQHLGADISVVSFQQRAEAILQGLRQHADTAAIVNGVGVPFFLPKATYADYGEALERDYLPAVQQAYADKLPQYDFTNHHKDGLAGKLSIAPSSRHELLLEAMQRGPVVGYFFPCLTEYAVPAAVEQVRHLPAQFLMAGGFDTCAAMMGSPDLLLRTDGYPPVLWLGAMLAESAKAGYHFEAYGYNLTFNRRVHFDRVAESWACGLVVLG
ncbi:hypothetical protein SFSGTM_01740 [Sulfuriferula nivalis]|uniref:Uncharacterized protein n=2 Tax=Sulfuriferula nivalis TaxID=2675298 RepID=A0A809RCT9_9PROT|nr:hypothetical protein SFSGTM_01740 [Sulfuriferula nivalis]